MGGINGDVLIACLMEIKAASTCMTIFKGPSRNILLAIFMEKRRVWLGDREAQSAVAVAYL